MKRLILSGIAVLAVSLSMGQGSKVLNAYNYLRDGELLKAKEEIEPATTHAKTGIDAKTWYYRGQIYERIYFYNEEDKDKFADMKQDALVKGVESYAKALEIGSKRIDMNDVRKRYQMLGAYAYQEGVNEFNEKDFSSAATFFEMCYNVKKQENAIDSGAIFNAGVAYLQGGDYEKSRAALKTAIEIGYQVEDSYVNIASSYEKEGNMEMYRKTLGEARQALPNSQSIVMAEINVYLESKEYDKALDNLNVAIENDPNNKTLFFARGNILDNKQANMLKEGQEEEAKVVAEKALADYQKALELDPSYFDAAYSIGAMIYNQGAELLNKANNLTDDAAYKKAKAIADARIAEALPFLEKAHEIKPDDVSTMTSLKELYARTNQMEKYKEMTEKLEN